MLADGVRRMQLVDRVRRAHHRGDDGEDAGDAREGEGSRRAAVPTTEPPAAAPRPPPSAIAVASQANASVEVPAGDTLPTIAQTAVLIGRWFRGR
jgi:hypothetical protein